MASSRKAPRIPWDGKNRHVNVEDIHGVSEQVRSHFTLPQVAYVGSSLGCGCGFRSLSFQNGDWPEEWLLEQGECEPPEEHLRNHQELHDLVISLMDGNHDGVELYGCWDGDESCKTEYQETIPAERLLEPEFWFRARGLYTIVRALNPCQPPGSDDFQ